jgi:hypothetical protein
MESILTRAEKRDLLDTFLFHAGTALYVLYGCRYLDDEEADLSLLSLLVTQRHAEHQPKNMSIIL